MLSPFPSSNLAAQAHSQFKQKSLPQDHWAKWIACSMSGSVLPTLYGKRKDILAKIPKYLMRPAEREVRNTRTVGPARFYFHPVLHRKVTSSMTRVMLPRLGFCRAPAGSSPRYYALNSRCHALPLSSCTRPYFTKSLTPNALCSNVGPLAECLLPGLSRCKCQIADG